MNDYKRGVRWAYAIVFGLCLLCLGAAETDKDLECVKDRDCEHRQRCIDGVCKVKP